MARFSIVVQPKASRTAVSWEDGIIRVRVTAPPVKGRANEAVIEALAAALALRRSQVRIVSGERARRKQVELPLDPQEVRARLGG